MKNMDLKKILDGVHGTLLIEGECKVFSDICIDSRKVKDGDIFFAIKGENFDGHHFISAAIEGGAKVCVIHQEIELDNNYNNVSIIKVKDTREALLDLASYYRDTLSIKVVGVTGSTGKTSTKDLIAATLSEKFKVFKTQGNFNNDIGLPLMILSLDNSYDIAVLEMGMNNLGEIERLAKVSKPDIAVITNVGISHIENLKTRENILSAKLEITTLFDNHNVLIINGDNDMLKNISSEKYEIVKIGIENNCEFNANNIETKEDEVNFSIVENGNEVEENILVPVPGRHNVLNSLLAIAVARSLGLQYSEISRGIKKLEATSMRLDLVECQGFTIINDTYNASPDSMFAALDVLKNHNRGRKIAVLGTMKELGDESCNAHKEVGEYAKHTGVDLLITMGEYNNSFREGYGCENLVTFDNMDELIERLSSMIKKDDVILVKASRSIKFENIVKAIQKKSI